MSGLVRAWLLEAATPRLYRGNAFRITGVPTDADRRTVRQRQQKINTMLELGADVDLGHQLPVTPGEAARAFELILGDPRRRLIDELFWLWDTANAACGCAEELHREHDAAVMAHSAALDQESGGGADPDDLEELWFDAARRWGEVLERPDFWDHPRHRIAALDDRQLDESVLDVLRDQLPTTLVRPLIQLAAASPAERGWLAGLARAWPVPSTVVDDLLEEAAAPRYDAVRAGLAQAAEALAAGDPVRAAGIVYERSVPEAEWLAELVPPEEHRHTASARNEVAVALNNCATTLMDMVGPRADEHARPWLESALELAADPHTRSMVEHNREMLADLVTTLRAIEDRVAWFRSAGRPDLAGRMLRGIRRRLRGAPGTSEIDRLLAELGRQGRWRWRDRLAYVFSFALFAASLYWVFVPSSDSDGSDTGPATVAVFADLVAENAGVGTCIATRDGWKGDKGKVPAVPCDQPHWGEVLDYVSLGAVPSAYPGEDQTLAQASFDCDYRLAQQQQPTDVYTTSFAYPDQERWNAGGKRFENYVTCVLHRIDDQPMPTRQLTDPARNQSTNVVLRRDMFTTEIAVNPPAGSCIADKASYDASVHSVALTACSNPHWGQILGYPVLYAPGTPWPGDEAVRAAADAACLKLAKDWGLDDEFHYLTTPPGEDRWRDARPDTRFFAACAASRADGQLVTGGFSK